MRKLRPRKVTYLGQGHPDHKWQSQDSHLCVVRAFGCQHNVILCAFEWLHSTVDWESSNWMSFAGPLNILSVVFTSSGKYFWVSKNSLAMENLSFYSWQISWHCFFCSNFSSFLGLVPWINSLCTVNYYLFLLYSSSPGLYALYLLLKSTCM